MQQIQSRSLLLTHSAGSERLLLGPAADATRALVGWPPWWATALAPPTWESPDVVSVDGLAAGPLPSDTRRRDAVLGVLGDQPPLEVGDGAEDMEHELAGSDRLLAALVALDLAPPLGPPAGDG